jgi:ribosomal protein L11 methyltransferase
MIVMNASASQVLQFIEESSSKVSFASLKRHFLDDYRKNPRRFKRLIAELMQSGHLCYSSHFGSSFIDISYDRPQAVSDHVIIKPPRWSLKALPHQWVVTIERGASFGGGEHPTTRLAIQLIDDFLHLPNRGDQRYALRAVDIGTGSGVLAIVAATLGVGAVHGIDTDLCAVYEARNNVRLNFLEDQVIILDEDLQAITGTCDLVFANLRTPTLFGLRPVLEKKAAADSALFFSGIKTEEVTGLCCFYEQVGFLLHQSRSEKGWSAICLTRGSFIGEGPAPMAIY